jgi:hypothetical protein
MLPATWWLAARFGGAGVAAGWIVLNFGFLAVGVPLMHRRLLRGELGRWYLQDILPPAAAAVAVALSARLALPAVPQGPAGVAVLATIGGATLLAAALSSPASRSILRERLSSGAGLRNT